MLHCGIVVRAILVERVVEGQSLGLFQPLDVARRDVGYRRRAALYNPMKIISAHKDAQAKANRLIRPLQIECPGFNPFTDHGEGCLERVRLWANMLSISSAKMVQAAPSSADASGWSPQARIRAFVSRVCKSSSRASLLIRAISTSVRLPPR
jgi:hypothetical protein